MRSWGGISALLVGLIAASASRALALTLPTSAPSGPESVFVGFYINDIYGLDLKSGAYTVDFYVWLRWRGDIDPTNFEFLNGTLDSKEHPDYREADGTKYVSFHCRGAFHAVFDHRRYPLDEHELVMEMEDANHEANLVRYAVDQKNMLRLPPVAIAGWTCRPPIFTVRSNVYPTNFGDPTRPADATSAYSRFFCSVRIFHQGFSVYVKTFLAMFISVAIAFLSFVLKPTNMDPRFGVGLAAIFGAVSSEIVMSNNLPDMPYLTLADTLHLFSLFVIFLTLLLSCLTLRLVQTGHAKWAARIDRTALVAFPVVYAGVVVWITMRR